MKGVFLYIIDGGALKSAYVYIFYKLTGRGVMNSNLEVLRPLGVPFWYGINFHTNHKYLIKSSSQK